MRKNLLALSTIIGVFLSTSVQAAPITFDTAPPISRNEIILRELLLSHCMETYNFSHYWDYIGLYVG